MQYVMSSPASSFKISTASSVNAAAWILALASTRSSMHKLNRCGSVTSIATAMTYDCKAFHTLGMISEQVLQQTLCPRLGVPVQSSEAAGEIVVRSGRVDGIPSGKRGHHFGKARLT